MRMIRVADETLIERHIWEQGTDSIRAREMRAYDIALDVLSPNHGTIRIVERAVMD